MKKSAVIRLIIWSFTALLLTAVLVVTLVFTGGGRGLLGGFSLSFGGRYPDAASYTVGGGSVSERITSLSVEWYGGSIEVSAYGGDTVEISENGAGSDEDDALRYRVTGGRLEIKPRKSEWLFAFGSFKDKELTVKIPSAFMEDFRGLKIDSTTADIYLDGISASGSVEIENVSGEITAENITARSFECDTVSGGVSVLGAVSRFTFDSVSGDARLDNSVALSELEADTVSGDVTLILPENSGFEIEFDSVSGELECDFPLVSRDGEKICGAGGAEFSADSVSGDLVIRKNSGAGTVY